jgi:hypothetical protein
LWICDTNIHLLNGLIGTYSGKNPKLLCFSSISINIYVKLSNYQSAIPLISIKDLPDTTKLKKYIIIIFMNLEQSCMLDSHVQVSYR